MSAAPAVRDDTSFTPPTPEEAKRNKIVIGLLLVAAFVVILNETVMGVAVPRLMVDLGISAGTAQWLTSAFLLTMAVVIPVTGFLLQRLTTRAVFLLAMSSFTLGTFLAAIAPDFPVLLVARVVQAVGTAIMMPLLMTTVMTLVAPDQRGKTMGFISIVISVAPAIGPTISGIILNALDWRWMFWLVLPIAIGALALGYAMLRNVGPTRAVPLDLPSVVLAILGFGGIVYGLSALGEGASHGGEAPLPLWLAPSVGIVATTLFVLRQLSLQRKDAALLDLRTLQTKTFTIALIILALSMMSMFGGIILMPLLMQNVQGMTTLQAGLMMLPGGLIMGVMAPWVGRQSDLRGPKPLVVPGTILTTAALFVMGFAVHNFVILLLGHIMLSVGLALVFTPVYSSGMGALPRNLYSHGSAVIGTVQQVAGAAGIAALVAVMTIATSQGLQSGLDQAMAMAAGIRIALFVAGGISLLAVICSVFVRSGPAEH